MVTKSPSDSENAQLEFGYRANPLRSLGEALEPRGSGASNLAFGGYAMKCDICGEEIVNSEEMKAHKEREHPLDDSQEGELEKPDMLREQEERAPIVPGKN